MTEDNGDQIAAFYTSHPYPPPVDDLDADAATWRDGDRRRVEHHRLWPSLPLRTDHSILVAGCGTAQAARTAIRHPGAHVVGIDVSPTSIDATQRLRDRHQLTNLEVRLLPIEQVGDLSRRFDHIVCTGVLHHLEDPQVGLRALVDALTPDGAMHLMVYATYGRTGVAMMQDYCRRLGVLATDGDIAELVTSLRELPAGHPIRHLLSTAPDFGHHDALADALLNPRERSYTVPELLALVDDVGLRFARWVRQAPYRPQCGALSETPHATRIAELDEADQFATVELYRGTMTRHAPILYRADSPLPDPAVPWDDAWPTYVPLRPSTTAVIDERLPPGAAAALMNRAHVDRDLVLFVDEPNRRIFEAVDGERPLGDIEGATAEFFRRLWWHDLVVIDASGTRDRSG